MHANSKLLFSRYGKPFIGPNSRLLEVGPDSFPSSYQQLVDDRTITWDTLDLYDSEKLTYPKASEYVFPVPDEAYDVVLTGQVIEHVRKIWLWILELERVCKKGGYVIIINPVSWIFHEWPVDCWRIYPEGMKALLEDTNLRIIDCRFESLETPGYKRYQPGVSAEFQHRIQRLFHKITGPLGFPVQRAYDTITVAQKQ
jgi:SAM-dependent methyltransferase